MRKTTSGFTIVELLVVIAVIGILTTVGLFSFSTIQSNARNSQRSSKITAIAEALEKYYDQNGEYPSCTAMYQSASVILPDLDPSNLATPTAASGANSILNNCNDLTTSSDSFAYVGSSCTTTCLKYTLKYRDEISGSYISLSSRR